MNLLVGLCINIVTDFLLLKVIIVQTESSLVRQNEYHEGHNFRLTVDNC